MTQYFEFLLLHTLPFFKVFILEREKSTLTVSYLATIPFSSLLTILDLVLCTLIPKGFFRLNVEI